MMTSVVDDFVRCKRLAIVGVSRTGKSFGNMAYKELKARGYQVYIVHPQAAAIDGEPCYSSLAALKGKVDGVVVCVPSTQAVEVVREAAALGINNVWLQQGIQADEALKLARVLDLNVVANKCILLYAPPVRSYHGWHRTFAKLTGRL